MLDANKGRPLPVIPLRIGLVTSADSAAYADFLRTLTESGFSFQILHAAATMQGTATATSVVSAVRRLQEEPLDLICIVRGGGSPIDLAWLDHEKIARAVAACPLPIWVGIGHEIDLGVLDHIAHASHKTPTALAEALVGLVREVDNRLTAAAERLTETGSRLVDLARQRLETRENGLRQGTRKHQQIQDARFGQKVGRLQTLLAQHTERRVGHFQKAATRLLERSRAILDRSDAELAAAAGPPGRTLSGWPAPGRRESTVRSSGSSRGRGSSSRRLRIGFPVIRRRSRR